MRSAGCDGSWERERMVERTAQKLNPRVKVWMVEAVAKRMGVLVERRMPAVPPKRKPTVPVEG